MGMLLQNYQPVSKLVTPHTAIPKPRFPSIDAHNHLGGAFGEDWRKHPISQLLDLLDEAGVVQYVDLDGGWGEPILHAHLEYFKQAAPERFHIFGGVDWSKWREKGAAFPAWAANRLRAQKERGAEGLKIWKGLGLSVTDEQGKLVDVDDQRLAPIWETAGEIGLPVLIHVADPLAFFDQVNERNERWEELQNNPDWVFISPPFPPFHHIIGGLANLVSAHPQTKFIGAHVGCYAENLAWVGALLDRCPNFLVDISARIAELGRQPYTARKFMIRYADRVLFGSDMGPDPEEYRVIYRFLETDDEYFSYSPSSIGGQGRWNIYGLFLPDRVLKKIYYQNAQKLFKKD